MIVASERVGSMGCLAPGSPSVVVWVWLMLKRPPPGLMLSKEESPEDEFDEKEELPGVSVNDAGPS